MVALPQATIIQLYAPTPLPNKLTSSNFLIWRKQVESTLIKLDLVGYVNSNFCAPPKYFDAAQTTLNTTYTIWFRQDQIIFNAILGGLTNTLQLVISSMSFACDAWNRLSTTYDASS